MAGGELRTSILSTLSLFLDRCAFAHSSQLVFTVDVISATFSPSVGTRQGRLRPSDGQKSSRESERRRGQESGQWGEVY